MIENTAYPLDCVSRGYLPVRYSQRPDFLNAGSAQDFSRRSQGGASRDNIVGQNNIFRNLNAGFYSKRPSKILLPLGPFEFNLWPGVALFN